MADERVFVETPCKECGEPTYNPEYCRECGLERQFAMMTCSVCKKLRTVRPDPAAKGLDAGTLADALYGDDHRCECNPRPPSEFDAKER